jgi:predicted membrane protein
MKNRNWFWAIFFLLSAVFVIASQTGSFGEIGMLSILATVMLVALTIHSAVNRNFFGVFVPLAFLYMIYRQPLNFVQISVWLLLLAAVLASIGFSIIFPVRPPNFVDHSHRNQFVPDGSCGNSKYYSKSTENMDDNNPYAKVSFGSSSKYLHADCLKSGRFFVSFGELEVFFDQAQLSPDGAELFLDCSFGSIKLYVPKQWRVIDWVRVSLGSVENDMRLACPDENAPELVLKGNVQLASVEIHYI